VKFIAALYEAQVQRIKSRANGLRMFQAYDDAGSPTSHYDHIDRNLRLAGASSRRNDRHFGGRR
jgi:hypothetical protein